MWLVLIIYCLSVLGCFCQCEAQINWVVFCHFVQVLCFVILCCLVVQMSCWFVDLPVTDWWRNTILVTVLCFKLSSFQTTSFSKMWKPIFYMFYLSVSASHVFLGPCFILMLKGWIELQWFTRMYNSVRKQVLKKNYICCMVTQNSLTNMTTLGWLQSLTSNPVTSLAWVWSPGDALVVWHKGSTGSSQDKWLGNYQSAWLKICWKVDWRLLKSWLKTIEKLTEDCWKVDWRLLKSWLKTAEKLTEDYWKGIKQTNKHGKTDPEMTDVKQETCKSYL